MFFVGWPRGFNQIMLVTWHTGALQWKQMSRVLILERELREVVLEEKTEAQVKRCAPQTAANQDRVGLQPTSPQPASTLTHFAHVVSGLAWR